MESMRAGEQVLAAKLLHKMAINSQLGIAPIINGVGPATRLGGLSLSENVWGAMKEASLSSYRMDELHLSAGALIAKMIGAPASLVTSGASASLTLSAAAAIAGFDRQMLIDLPFPKSKKVEILVQRVHQDPYDHALTAAGAKIIAFGDSNGSKVDQLHAALNSNVCALLWRESEGDNALDLATCSKIAHENGILVIVDGALFVPPVSRLQDYLKQGADFVAISGGKSFRGPHTSGLLVASPANIKIALLHHLDLDERSATWSYEIGDGQFADLPTNGIGRAMKVGREQIFGLVAAIQDYLREPSYQVGDAEVNECKKVLDQGDMLRSEMRFYSPLNVTNLHIPAPKHLPADQFYNLLASGTPRIILGQEMSDKGFLTLNPMALQKGEGSLIGRRINEIAKEG